ncbi:MAG: DUF814 domain-containing protein [Helicobacteraceae bacterium]|nr:DUF814 domain-containing protein [Helicobacteraceae bacterium]
MKFSHLKHICTHIQKFKNIYSIYRSSDNTLAITFDSNETLYFNMQRGNSYIFKNNHIQRNKVYQAPFDVVLHKRFNRSQIESIQLHNNDKILRFYTTQKSSYKSEKTILQFEFTGKYTNIIILDEDENILEALRHIDADVSTRVVKVGVKLTDVPPPTFTPKEYVIENIEEYLYEADRVEKNAKLTSQKKQKISLLNKKLLKLEKKYNALENIEELEIQIENDQLFGNLLLANIHKIKPFMKEVKLDDYEGKEQLIIIPDKADTISKISNYYFKSAKKAKQKIKHLHIEKENLEGKITHLKHFIQIVEEVDELSKLSMLFPAKKVNKKVLRENESYETFFIEGYKVQVGKNEKGNILLLESAKARDIWLHMKDRPSTHVIISTDKQSIPQSVIYSSAKLCVDFSLFEKGNYLVDYTPRREVKIQHGANVLYNKYKTITVTK